MSKKLTFSLASLVLLIGLIAIPGISQAQAQEEGVLTVQDTAVIGQKTFAVLASTGTGITPVVSLTDPPDLEKLFRQGVTITLLARTGFQLDGVTPVVADTAAALKVAKHDIVFSEIMWALNATGAFNTYQSDQWIELYNTIPLGLDALDTSDDDDPDVVTDPGNIIEIDDWLIHYATGRDSLFATMNAGATITLTNASVTTPPLAVALAAVAAEEKTEYIIVDQVNNLRRGGLGDPPGQNGKADAAGVSAANALENPVGPHLYAP